jgi:elongation factor Ts
VADDDKEPESMESSTSQNADDTVQALEKEAEANDKEPESTESSLSQSVDDSVTGSGTRTRYIFPRIA